jgi:hypothetical protein
MSNKDLFVERRREGDYAVRRANSERARRGADASEGHRESAPA